MKKLDHNETIRHLRASGFQGKIAVCKECGWADDSGKLVFSEKKYRCPRCGSESTKNI